jgi:hypothetical protein
MSASAVTKRARAATAAPAASAAAAPLMPTLGGRGAMGTGSATTCSRPLWGPGPGAGAAGQRRRREAWGRLNAGARASWDNWSPLPPQVKDVRRSILSAAEQRPQLIRWVKNIQSVQ